MNNLEAWLPAIISVIASIIVVGKTVGRIDNQEITLKQHHDRIGAVENKTIEHSIEIAESRGWQKGFKAGKSDQED